MWIFLIGLSLFASPAKVINKCYTARDVMNEGCKSSCIIIGEHSGYLGTNNHCYCTIDKGTYKEFIHRTMRITRNNWVPTREENSLGLVAPFNFSNGSKGSIIDRKMEDYEISDE